MIGHSETALRGLDQRGAPLADLSGELLQRAGIGAGMRVLDLGSGTGYVAIEAARLVGSSGTVLGIDRAPDVVARAGMRSADEGLPWCRFVVADPGHFECEEPFDAVIGRLVLVKPVSRATTVIRLVLNLRQDGALALQKTEVDGAMLRSSFSSGPA